MKKIIMGLLVIVMSVTCTSCFKKDNLEGATIYTTVYPIEYIVNVLYGKNSSIKSIYPNGSDVTNYKLTKKQIDEYSGANIFVYNGLSNEKEIAKTFLNKNKKLKILDVAYGLKYNDSIEELWLSPSNFLMLASTTKTNLEDIIENKYLDEEIEKNYKNLEEEISIMDAELRTIASSAKEKGNNVLVVSSNTFNFLKNYGFEIISLENEDNLTTNNLASIKSNFKNKKYTAIFMKDTDTKNDLINELTKNYEANIVTVNAMNTLSDDNIKNNDNYISLMNDFLENIRNVTLG